MKRIITSKHIITIFSLLLTHLAICQNIQLVDYYMSECSSESNSYMEIDRVSDINHTDNGLTEITLSVKGNCAMSDSISVSSSLDSIFFFFDYPIIITEIDTIGWDGSEPLIETTSYFEQTDCNCCFTINLTLGDYNGNTDYKFISNDEEIPFTEHRFPLKPVSFEVIEGDTINYSDQYGFRQGRWILYNKNNLPSIDAEYLDHKINSGKAWKLYDEDNNIVSEEEYKNGRHISDLYFYPSGNLKRRCSGPYRKTCEDYLDEVE